MLQKSRPPSRLTVLGALGAAFLATAAISVQAQEARFYDPANAASGSGFTSGYELYRTIGCPGRELLGRECPVPAPAAPVKAAPVKAAPQDSDGDGVTDDKDKCPNTPAGAKVDASGCELDSDGDGVVDRLDRCPDTPAGRKVDAQGCEPDSDGDGVVDALDKCPDTPRGAKVNAQGCELDSDGDGVVDRLDRCPGTPPGRKVDANGCELDSDGDGVVDGLDQCPDTPRGDKVDSKGCTLTSSIILKGVNFDFDADVIRDDAKPILDDAVATLKRYPALKVEVAGHTDSVNEEAYNQPLSERRAKAVMDYFVSQGIAAARLTAKGYGESSPIADNATADGRAQNRRVELRVLE
ncbi:MAG: OmpA family protein [Thiobacillaceae bacterium]|jgi:OOP family OmpA-OmpF porin|nr:OmpA family protein [Thiobacillaceae bacterium]